MENKTENKPLYKVLDEKRQQGTMEAVQFDSPHKDICIKLSEYKINGQWHFSDRVCDNLPDIETAQYTALAVNNLHILAEALEYIKNQIEALPEMGNNGRTIVESLCLNKAKQALSRIS